MQSTDAPAFTALIARTWRFYGKAPTGEDVAAWFDLLAAFPLDTLAAAFNRHLTDTERGQYLPKPADIIRQFPARQADEGRPGPDEAWGLLLRLIQDEQETGVLTDEMRAGWETCAPILKRGDEVGARKCFLETYTRAVQAARAAHPPPRWTVTLGTDPQRRIQRLSEAVAAHRLTADHALLPGPAPASLDQVAGLLAGPEASAEERNVAERLRALAALLRASSAQDEDRRAEQRQREREAQAARRADLLQQWADRANDRKDAA